MEHAVVLRNVVKVFDHGKQQRVVAVKNLSLSARRSYFQMLWKFIPDEMKG